MIDMLLGICWTPIICKRSMVKKDSERTDVAGMIGSNILQIKIYVINKLKLITICMYRNPVKNPSVMMLNQP